MARGVVSKLLWSLPVSAVLLVTAELTARLVFAEELRAWSAPAPAAEEGAPLMTGSPYLLWEMAPGVRQQRGHDVHINSLGLRGPEIEQPKPAGRRRLVTVGDSSVFGDGVGDDEVFGVLAAADLGPEVDHVNAALPGYSTYQSINLLRMRVLELQPDLLVIGSLWSDNNFDAFVDRDLLSAYAAWEQGGTARLRRGLAHSAIFRTLDWKLRVAERAAHVRQVGFMLGSEAKVGRRRVAIQDYADNLEIMVDLALRQGAEVLFVVLANVEDLDREPSATSAWEPYRQVMRDTARRHGAQVIEVPSLFAASALSADTLFVDQMHPSATGHRLIARELLAVLRQADWVAGQRVMSSGLGGPVPRYEDPALVPPGLAPPSPGDR